MEHNSLQRRSATSIKIMGINSYSQIVSAFRAQGDLTEEKLAILPVLQNVLGISRERHTAEIKRALYDEHLSEIASSLNPSSSTAKWEIEANHIFPTIVHRPPHTESVQLAENVLRKTSPNQIIQHPKRITTISLNHDLQQIVNDERKYDGIINATQPNSSTKINQNGIDFNGSKVVRLVRAKSTTKPKSNLDTLVEVLQKELLRSNMQTNTISSTKFDNPLTQSTTNINRPILPSILPPQANSSFKLTRKRSIFDMKSTSKRFDHDHIQFSYDKLRSESENIEEIVRDILDGIIATIHVNNAPYAINMYTPIPGHDGETKFSTVHHLTNTTLINKFQSNSKFDTHRTDVSSASLTTAELRNQTQQTSPLKSNLSSHQQIPSSQLILQSTTNPISTAPTLFVAPRILNFQTVVPKPTTNIQIGNTKIILVSPSNITQHLPHSTPSIQQTTVSTSQQQNLVNNSPVKLVKITTTNPTNPIATRSTTLPINPNQTSTLNLPKNVQIVIPSQNSSAIQLTRPHNDDTNKSISTATFRPMALSTCTIDQIPQAAQEVTITTSPRSSPPLTGNSAELQHQSTLVNTIEHKSHLSTVQQSSLQNLTATRTSPTNDDLVKSVAVNIPSQSQSIQRPSSTHGPMIYRMTSVNPSVPVFRVRATTATTNPTNVLSKPIKTDTKPMSVTAATSMCYEPKSSPHPTTSTNNSLSVLACFQTTKKRNKERAIMPRPSTMDSNDTSQDSQQRSNSINTSLIVNNDLFNANLSSTPTRFVQQTSLSSTFSDDNTSNILSFSTNEQNLDTSTSSSNSIPIQRSNSTHIKDLNNSIQTIISPISSPKLMTEDKSIQCFNNNNESHFQENLIESIDEQYNITNIETKKRSNDDDDWKVDAENLLRDILSHECFNYLDTNCQQILTTKIDSIRTNLLNGLFAVKDDFYNAVFQLKKEINHDGLSNVSEENFEKLFNYFHTQYQTIIHEVKRPRRE